MNEYKKQNKASKRWLTGSLTLLAGGAFLQGMGTQASADSQNNGWQANSVAEVKASIQGQDLKTYVLKDGDTVWAISQAMGVSVQKITDDFHLPDANRVMAGQTLMLTGQQAQALAQKLVRADTAGQASQTAASQVNQAEETAGANAQAAADQAAKEQAEATAAANAQAAADQAAKEQAEATAAANAQTAADQAAKEQAEATAAANAQTAADRAAKEQAEATAAANAQAAADRAAKEQAEATAAANAKAAAERAAQEQAAASQTQQPQVSVQPAASQGDATANAMNQLRSSKGLAPVQWDANLAAQARNRAQQIYNNGHQIPANHFHTGNEVIAMAFAPGNTVVQAWYNETNMIGAPGHRNWLMNAGWSRVGFAQVGDVIVGLAG